MPAEYISHRSHTTGSLLEREEQKKTDYLWKLIERDKVLGDLAAGQRHGRLSRTRQGYCLHSVPEPEH